MLKHLSICILFLCSNSIAKECKFSWEINGLGFFLGKHEDHLVLKEDNYNIRSTVTPTSFSKILGMPFQERIIVLDKDLNLISKKEVNLKEKNEFNEWKPKANNTIEKINKSGDKEEISVSNFPFLDSTSFPYLLLIQNNLAKEYNIITTKKIIPTQIEEEKNTIKISYKNYLLTGFFENKFPTKIILKDGSVKIESKLVNKTCTDF